MAVPQRTPLPDLPKGHQFPVSSFQVTAEDVACYLDAVQDRNALYLEHELAPPLAVAALALGALLNQVELPAGTLHTGQEVESRGGVPVGAALALHGSIAQRSERSGLIISAIEFEVMASGAESPAIVGRTTVMAPANNSSGGGA